MATAAVLVAMNDGQNMTLHPFFSKTSGTLLHQSSYRTNLSDLFQAPLPPLATEIDTTKPDASHDAQSTNGTLPAQGSEGVDTDIMMLDGTSEKKTVTTKGKGKPRSSKKTSPSAKKKDLPTKSPEAASPMREDTIEDQSEGRRKRRRLSQEDFTNVGAQVNDARPESWPYPGGSEDVLVPASSPRLLVAHEPENGISSLTREPTNHALLSDPEQRSMLPSDTDELANSQTKAPPKKMLKLNPGGKLVSPVPRSEATVGGIPEKKPAKRGRPKKEKHLLAVGRYVRDGPTGQLIDRILSSQERYILPAAVTQPPPLKPKTVKPAISKSTHPFFLAKSKDEPHPKSDKDQKSMKASTMVDLTESPRKTSAVTPGKIRAERQSLRAMEVDDLTIPVSYGASRDRTIVKVPGMTEAPWPAKDFAHVRGDFDSHYSGINRLAGAPITPRTAAGLSRKMKHKIAALDLSENLLSKYRRELDFNQKDRLRPDGFCDPPQSLRLPERLLVPGSEIQGLARMQLHTTPMTTNNATILSGKQAPNTSSVCHPACQSMHEAIASTLTPYDEGKSEAMAWAQKYSPKSASQVLQAGKEATILRDWMKNLTIMAVEISSSQTSKPNKSDSERKHKKRRRKKAEDLEGFIVDSDGDGGVLDELADPDENPSIAEARSGKRSLVHTADVDQGDRVKLANVILISGPSGSGKTAMAHAVAKELGFEIFEINSGARRSGKDVLDKVGDMVENHLVQQHSAESGNTSADEDGGRLAEAFKKDLASGRQGTMASFFKPKPGSSPELKKIAKPKVAKPVQPTQSKPKASRNQKQSLILLEEVDILFEEDKNFWPTVFTLVQNSKRPVIMTCNDEDLVPIQALKLHAILRLCAPPADLATDYLLLMAAREGHVLSREAVGMLYESQGQDLRQSIANLQLWCQMGVGDPRGGLGWIFQRWPPGRGIDEHGQVLRVASKDTYQLGMGCFNHDPGNMHGKRCDEEALLESWENWEIDPRDGIFAGVEIQQKQASTFNSPQDQLAVLKQYESLSDSLSATDIFSSSLPGDILIDPTQPLLAEKAHTNYISGLALLQTPNPPTFSNLSSQIAVTTTSLLSTTHEIPLKTTPTHLLQTLTAAPPSTYTRADFSSALDPLAAATTNSPHAPTTLTYSIIDGAFGPIATDVAPYVRSIIAFDAALAAQRAQTQGKGKARTTRAARSALEGGLRRLTRRERWFDADVDFEAVLGTGPRFAVAAVAAGAGFVGDGGEGNAGVDEMEE